MFDPAQLHALRQVLRTGSFERAAAALNVTPSAISQRIRALEDQLGTILIIRGQPALPTEAGARLARHAEDVLLLEQGLAADLGTNIAPGRPTLRLAVNADSLATWVLPALKALPDTLFDLVIDDQDHSADWLRRGAVQAAVTAQGAAITGCDTHALGALRYSATASPEFIDKYFAEGVTANALAHAPSLVFNQKDRLQSDWVRQITGQRVELQSHFLGSSQGFVEAALQGLGWGMNPETLVADHLKAGRLRALQPDAPMDVMLHWQVNRLGAAAITPLTRAVKEAAARILRPASV
ncbi:MAG: LysR family transcriptional regulator ArgP [Albidovulum sp.]